MEVDLGRAVHVSRIRDSLWKPYQRKTPRRRPARRWRDELDDYWKGTIWQRIAQDRQLSSSMLRHSPNHRALLLHTDCDDSESTFVNTDPIVWGTTRCLETYDLRVFETPEKYSRLRSMSVVEKKDYGVQQ